MKKLSADKKGNLWDLGQYQLFEKERNEPFYDLLNMIPRKKRMRILDLGCGSGHLTKILHQTLKSSYTLGIDQSPEMLAGSKKIQEPNLTFQQAEVNSFLTSSSEQFDLIFSNACLQWLPNHPKLFLKIRKHLSPNGKIAIQMPSNDDYFTHTIAKQLASESPFKEFVVKRGSRRVLKLEQYAALLNALGFRKQCVRMQVYGHLLDSTESVVEWVKGSLLTYYKSLLPPSVYKVFFRLYRERIFMALGDVKPFFFPTKRILMFADLGDSGL